MHVRFRRVESLLIGANDPGAEFWLQVDRSAPSVVAQMTRRVHGRASARRLQKPSEQGGRQPSARPGRRVIGGPQLTEASGRWMRWDLSSVMRAFVTRTRACCLSRPHMLSSPARTGQSAGGQRRSWQVSSGRTSSALAVQNAGECQPVELVASLLAPRRAMPRLPSRIVTVSTFVRGARPRPAGCQVSWPAALPRGGCPVSLNLVCATWERPDSVRHFNTGCLTESGLRARFDPVVSLNLVRDLRKSSRHIASPLGRPARATNEVDVAALTASRSCADGAALGPDGSRDTVRGA